MQHGRPAFPGAKGMQAMDPPLCGSAVIGHHAVRKTDQQSTARRTSSMQQALSLVAIDLAQKSSLNF
jgi:hypothetical protein